MFKWYVYVHYPVTHRLLHTGRHQSGRYFSFDFHIERCHANIHSHLNSNGLLSLEEQKQNQNKKRLDLNKLRHKCASIDKDSHF